MKNYILFLFFIFFFFQSISQTISYFPYDTICCANGGASKNIDVDQDGVEEIRIANTILTDVSYFYVESLENNIKVTSVVEEGEAFNAFESQGNISLAGIACLYFSYPTGDPNRFIGVQEFSGTDTLWSYIEIEFSEEDTTDNSCWDARVIVLEAVHNPTPNQEIQAGEIITSAINISVLKDISIFPNPVLDVINLEGNLSDGYFQVINLNGIIEKEGVFQNSEIDVSKMNSGIYFLKIEAEENTYFKKIVKLE